MATPSHSAKGLSPELPLLFFVLMIALQYPIGNGSISNNFWLILMYGQVICIALPVALWCRYKKIPLHIVLPWPTLRGTHVLGALAATAILTIGTEQLISLLQTKFHTPPLFDDFIAEHLTPQSIAHGALILICLVLLPSMCEEFFFRGFCFAALSTRMNPYAVILATSALFALAHGTSVYLGLYFLLGCYLGWLRWRSQSITLPILAHATNNFMTILLKNIG